MTPLNIGLLGYGRIAELVHVPVLLGLANAKLCAVAELDPARRTQAERVTGAKGYATVEALLAARAVDAVVVCLATPEHADAAIAAFEAGLHVYLEKPIATSAPDAARVLAAWRAAGTVGMSGLNFRFSPRYQELRQLIAQGALGRIVSARSVFTSAPRTLPPWKQRRETGGGVLIDLAAHHVDLLRFLLDDPVMSVQAQVRTMITEEDTASLQGVTRSGALYQGSFSLAAPESHRFEVIGEVASAAFDRALDRAVRVIPVRGAHTRARRLERVLDAMHPGSLLRGVQPERSFARALATFVSAARGGNPVSPSLDDGAVSLQVILAAEASARDGGRHEVAPVATVGRSA